MAILFVGVTRFELAASTSLTWRATSCATPRSLCLASVSQQTQALLYKSVTGKARGIFRYSANTQTRSDLQKLLRPIMHLGFAFPAFTDAFRSSTCISELIFQQIRITFPSQMHPCQAFPANQDHFPLANASLPEFSCKSGSFLTCKCIPARIFPQTRITFPSQMHPCQNFPANQDHFPQTKLCWNIDRKQSPALFHKFPVPSQIIHAVYASGRRYRIEEFGYREITVVASELEYIADLSVNLLHAVS